LNPDGTVDQSFEAKPNSDCWYVSAVALVVDGRVLVGGNLTGFEGVSKPYLARLNADGKMDRTFFGSVDGAVMKIQVLADGRILMGGFFTTPRKCLARLNPNGSFDPSFSLQPALNGHVWDFEVLPDGRIMVVGAFTSTGGTNRNGVARLNPDGTLDPTFDAGLGANDIVRAVAIQPNGWVVIGGHFTAVNGQPRNYLARLRSDGTRPIFAPPTLLANGDVRLRLIGNAGSKYVVEACNDLVTWTPLWTNILTGTSWAWTEPSAAAGGSRFYRAHQAQP
jgi:uncharacterized delta-60 repeat protein